MIDDIKKPDGAVQKFIDSQQNKVVDLSVAALGVLVQGLSVLLFTFYLVADGPKLRRSICSRLPPERQRPVLDTWELAIDKTGGYLYSRALLAGLSALFHWVVLQVDRGPGAGRAGPVGRCGQPVPAGGRHLHRRRTAGPGRVHRLAGEGARRADLHRRVPADRELPVPAAHHRPHDGSASGDRLRCGDSPVRAVLGAVGAILAIPAAAMMQALLSEAGTRHEVHRQPPHHRAAAPCAAPSAGKHARNTPLRRSPMPTPDDFAPVADHLPQRLRRIGALRRRRRARAHRRRSSSRSAIRRPSSFRARRTNRCRPWRWSAPVSRSRRSCSRSCARATTAPLPTDGARRILTGAGLVPDDLANTPSMPLDEATALAVLRSGGGKTSLQMNCSGKHSGMLATCVHQHWPHDASTSSDHPLQLAITDTIDELCGEPHVHIGVDGCGAPAHAMSLARSRPRVPLHRPRRGRTGRRRRVRRR